ncbi:MAG: helix-hairpin-helix domain-containing protein [Bacteroidetes bacterium]|nr:helix-hairpin-helix domain-containing protein [Bacteroidota bacterium]MBS1649322.1 helix-hairpin-helix domain-containing protein [Bacteroidota bacterium]
MKKILKEYFTFSRKERTALIILILLISVFIVLPYIIPFKKEKLIINEQLQQQVTQLLVKDSLSNNSLTTNEISNEKPYTENLVYEMFEFNPNTINEEGWKKLGLKDKTIKTILNYRSKGGKFKTAEDIRKIWGLKKEDADRIIPYVKIENKASNAINTKSDAVKTTLKIDINIASPQEWLSIPNIDRSTVYKIIKYKEKLGGFLIIQQVKETYGLTDSLFKTIEPYLILQTIKIKKININSVDEYSLSTHPYISKDVAKAIIIYRAQHGAYTKIDDIKKIVFIKEELYQKISPYLAVE